MTTEELEQLMKAHKCWFTIESNDEGYDCELTEVGDGIEILGHGSGPSIVEAVYEALKSKCGADVKVRGCGPMVEWFDQMGNRMQP